MTVPAVDFVETEKGFEVAADLPGLDAKEVEVKIAGGVLTVKAEKEEEKCRFTLIVETARVQAFQGFTGDSPFFVASKSGLESHFRTLEMGLIDWSIDWSLELYSQAAFA